MKSPGERAGDTAFTRTRDFIGTIGALAVALLFIHVMALPAAALQVTLTWDGGTNPNVTGYRLYYGSSSGAYDRQLDVGFTTTCTVFDISDSQPCYFALTAYDSSGNESGYSNEVSTNAPETQPGTGPTADGDANGDSRVDMQDALLALRIATGLVPASPELLARADTAPLVGGSPSPDGRIDVADSLLILRKVVGLANW